MKPFLDKISLEVETYGKAFTPMAKRNVALAIQERIADFETEWKRQVPYPLPMSIHFLRSAARIEAGANVSVHKYTHASCIAYKVGTGAFDTEVFRANWNKEKDKWERAGIVKYTGQAPVGPVNHPESLSERYKRLLLADQLDEGQRRARMEEAIGKAYELYQSAHGADPDNSKALKIFMAPEFFYRGMNGAYDISLVSEIFLALRGFTKDDKYKDWLFVLGTVIAASFDDQMRCSKCGTGDFKNFTRLGPNHYVCKLCPDGTVEEVRLGARIDNVALIQKGGEDTERNSYIVEKEYVSHVDFRRVVTAEALQRGKDLGLGDKTARFTPWSAPTSNPSAPIDRKIEISGVKTTALAPTGSRDLGGGGSKFTDERMGGSVFTIDGIKFGLEICLDHLNARIGPGTGIQIQLVPSAGASLKQFACIHNGIAFNVDGGRDGSCNLRINDSGKKPEESRSLRILSSAVPSGGQVVLYEPHLIPYA
jgi:hypothetical protein